MSLDAIAIVSLFGGSGAVWRTAVGFLLLAALTNIFDALELDSNFQSLIKRSHCHWRCCSRRLFASALTPTDI